MTSYPNTLRMVAISLVLMFATTTAHPSSFRAHFASHELAIAQRVDHLAINYLPDWNTLTFSAKSPFLGTTWNVYIQQQPALKLRTAKALEVNAKAYCTFFVTPTINAP